MTLGHQGNVVLVGRGAQSFLPPQGGLRVRLVAPLDVRVQRVVLLDHISPEEAKVKIKKVDAGRAAFIWKLFKKDVGSPLNYDVIINTGEISIGNTAQIVLDMLYEKLGVTIQPRPKPPTERRDFEAV